MMGKEHALVGFGAYAAGASAAAHAGLFPTEFATAGALTAGALVSAGAALIPDIDHPSGTVANAGGPITRAIAHATNAVSGGHREGTHQLWFAAAFFLLVWATTTGAEAVGTSFNVPALITWHVLASCIWFTVIVAFGAQATSKTFLHQKLNRIWQQKTGVAAKAYAWAFAVVSCLLAWLLCGPADTWGWLVPAVITGHLSHLLTDALTSAGLEILPGKRIYLPILGDTTAHNPVQMLLGVATAVVGIAAIIFAATGWSPQAIDFGHFSFT